MIGSHSGLHITNIDVFPVMKEKTSLTNNYSFIGNGYI